MNEQTITREFVLEMLNYIPETGQLLQKKKRPKVTVGEVAGVITPSGYRYIQLQHRKFAAHRLIWLIEHNKFPAHHLDHIDGNGLNNHISNLREATPKQNNENKIAQKNNKLGVRGVCFNKRLGKFIAQIQNNGKNIHIGVFPTLQEAQKAYTKTAEELFTHYQTNRQSNH